MLALATFLYEDERLGGVVGLSGIQAMSGDPLSGLSQQQLQAKANTPMFLYHGAKDDLLPLDTSIMTYSLFDKLYADTKHNYNFTVEKKLGHSISYDETVLLSKWLHEKMPDKPVKKI